MATKGGSEALYKNHLKAQGKSRMTPSTFARNNLAKGGVNKHLGGMKNGKGK